MLVKVLLSILCAKKAVCKAAPLAGETKVWQYITLMKKIFLVDCPGIVQPSGDSETEIILKGVVRVEKVQSPDDHIEEVLKRVKREYIIRQYLIPSWTDHEDFLTQMAKRTGKLLKKGVPDLKTCAKKVLNDWQRGRIPYFVRPEGFEDEKPVTEDHPEKVEKKQEEKKSSEEKDAEAKVTAKDLEKKLQLVEQNLDEVKIGFDFVEDSKIEEPVEEVEEKEEPEDDVDREEKERLRKEEEKKQKKGERKLAILKCLEKIKTGKKRLRAHSTQSLHDLNSFQAKRREETEKKEKEN